MSVTDSKTTLAPGPRFRVWPVRPGQNHNHGDFLQVADRPLKQFPCHLSRLSYLAAEDASRHGYAQVQEPPNSLPIQPSPVHIQFAAVVCLKEFVSVPTPSKCAVVVVQECHQSPPQSTHNGALGTPGLANGLLTCKVTFEPTSFNWLPLLSVKTKQASRHRHAKSCQRARASCCSEQRWLLDIIFHAASCYISLTRTTSLHRIFAHEEGDIGDVALLVILQARRKANGLFLSHTLSLSTAYSDQS